jgi:hypothetical protein
MQPFDPLTRWADVVLLQHETSLKGNRDAHPPAMPTPAGVGIATDTTASVRHLYTTFETDKGEPSVSLAENRVETLPIPESNTKIKRGINDASKPGVLNRGQEKHLKN